MPRSVVPDQKQDLLADPFELFVAPPEKLGRYRAYGRTIHESQLRLVEFGHIESVAGDGLRLGVVFSDRLLNEAQRLPLLGEAAQGGQSHPAPPAFV
jgi:hypothetical protein